MEDLVAVEVTLENGTARYFLTWGRIQDVVDPTELERIVLERSHRFSLGGRATKASLCAHLRDARDEPFFYEARWKFSQQPIPYGRRYQRWRRKTDQEMREGRHLYFLGSREPEDSPAT